MSSMSAKLAAKHAKTLPPSELSRVLRGAYEAIDGDDPQTCARIATTALKKYPRLQIARVLRALARVRMGVHDYNEAFDEVCAVRDEGVVDGSVLRAVLMFFREVDAPEEARETLELVTTSNPTNIDGLQSLFMEYVRERMFRDAQVCAMKMYKTTQDARHVLWATTCMLSQGEDEGADIDEDAFGDRLQMAPKMSSESLLALAKGMLGKLCEKGEIKEYDALALYARTLATSGERDKAYDVVASTLGDTCISMPIERERMRAQYALACGKRAEARAHHEKVLEMAPDDWDSMNAALDLLAEDDDAGALAKLCKDMQVLGLGATDGTDIDSMETLSRVPVVRVPQKTMSAAKATGFVESLVAKVEEGGGERVVGRGAYLLRVELKYRLLDDADEVSAMAFAESIAAYHERFGSWNSCAQDLRRYASALGGGTLERARSWLVDELHARAGACADAVRTADDESEKLKLLRRETSALVICADANEYGASWSNTNARRDVPVGRGRDVARSMMALYHTYRPQLTRTDPREYLPIDIFPYLASRALVAEGAASKAAGDDDGCVEALVSAAALLEIGLKHSPHNASMLFDLAALYMLLGASNKTLLILRKLDVKHIQMSTLMQHFLPAWVGGASEAEVNNVHTRLDYLEREIENDIDKSIVAAFINGKYTKCLEFTKFRRTLSSAHSLASASTQNAWASYANLLAQDPSTTRGHPLGPETSEFSKALLMACLQSLDLSQRNLRHYRARDDDGWTYVDDLKTNPSWLSPFVGDPALAACDWWASPIERDVLDPKYEWFYAGARDTLRRRVLLARSMKARNDDSSAELDAARDEREKLLAAHSTHDERSEQSRNARALDFALIDDVTSSSTTTRTTTLSVEDAFEQTCRAPIAALSKPTPLGVLARGFVSAAFHASSYAQYIRLARHTKKASSRLDAKVTTAAGELAVAAKASQKACEKWLRAPRESSDAVTSWYAANGAPIDDDTREVIEDVMREAYKSLISTLSRIHDRLAPIASDA